ncbi:phage head closure protein [Clostridium botulinum C/D]|uniref:phage head closure protein n=1 Tax=Clostridium botulinum TaxID=1491 RepID=UPI001E354311|nr:phage head closure protein [Clostridium botulinum]MCD3211111.1 phage head closure protein [Clostridium botulinum C/D]
MNPGILNKKVSLLTFLEEKNEVEDTVLKLKEIKNKVYARIEPLRGKEYLENKKTEAEQIYKVTIRYRKGINTDMFIKYKDKLLNINTVINPYEANERLEIMCTQKVENNE